MNNIVPKWIRGSEWSFLNTSDYPVVNFFFPLFFTTNMYPHRLWSSVPLILNKNWKGLGGGRPRFSFLFLVRYLNSYFRCSTSLSQYFWLALGAPEAPTSLTSLSPSTVPLLFFFRPSLYSSAGVREPHQHVDNYTLLYDHVVYFLTQFILFF